MLFGIFFKVFLFLRVTVFDSIGQQPHRFSSALDYVLVSWLKAQVVICIGEVVGNRTLRNWLLFVTASLPIEKLKPAEPVGCR